jgi:hypothetical protein
VEIQFSNILKIHKLSWAQYNQEVANGTVDQTALYIRPNEALTIQLNGGTTEGTNKFTYNGSIAKSMNITYSNVGAAAASHTHGNITNGGAIGTAANKAVITTTNGVLTTGTVPVGSGGTGQTTRVNAMDALFTLGNNAITSTTNDTTAKWGALGPGYSFYSTAGQLNDQPQQYGFVLNIPSAKSSEVFQIWHNQPSGNMYHRGGNNSNWSGTWRCLLDSGNYTTYVVPKTGGTFSGAITATSFTASSDKRLKENIDSYVCNKSILDLDVKKFDFINGEKAQIGCLAQELQEICPELVKEGEDGYLKIHESKLVYLLLQELKKENKRLAELEAKL